MPRREGPSYLDCGDAKMGESREPNLRTYSRYISHRAWGTAGLEAKAR